MKTIQFIRSRILQSFSSASIRARKRTYYRLKHRLTGSPHKVEYFHQLDDPYSHLAIQVIPKLTQTYDVELAVHLVGPPNPVDAPEAERLNRYARVDAERIAPFYGLQYVDPGAQPSTELVGLAQRILSAANANGSLVDMAVEVGEALWRGDRKILLSLAENSTSTEVTAELSAAEKRRQKLGHYLGATFHYDGEWYWGVDRLNYLEQRLQQLGMGTGNRVIKRPEVHGHRLEAASDITLEYFPSLRSPYTYISMTAVYEMAARTGIRLVMRPVLPMMMRGVPASLNKGKYIFSDCKREAEQVFNAPFGDICDPFGDPVKRGYSLFQWAQSQGKAQQLFLAFSTAAFANRVDTGSDEGMRNVVENAGLCWEQAKSEIDNNDWEAVLEQNRLDLYDMGLWGVPSFRLTGGGIKEPLVTWGADRLWLLEADIVRRTSKLSHFDYA